MCEVKYASGWMHPDDADKLQKQNQALLTALEEIARFGNSLSGKESAKRAENAIAEAMQGGE